MKFDIFKIKAIPRLFWSSPKTLTIKPPIVSFAFLILGLIIFGLGEALLIAAGVGVSPWTVFAQGFSIHTVGQLVYQRQWSAQSSCFCGYF